jgi:hypothetical protein
LMMNVSLYVQWKEQILKIAMS